MINSKKSKEHQQRQYHYGTCHGSAINSILHGYYNINSEYRSNHEFDSAEHRQGWLTAEWCLLSLKYQAVITRI